MPQSPARLSARSTAAVEITTDEKLTISGDRPLRKHDHRTGLGLIIRAYNVRSLTNNFMLNQLMDEKRKIKCDILGLCETRRNKHLEARWKDGSYNTLGEDSGSRSVGGLAS